MIDDVVRLVQVFTPLMIALVSGVWVLYKYIESRREKAEAEASEDDAPIAPVQGQPVVAEWTWQDELKDARGRLEAADSREDVFREALVRVGVSPRRLLEEAGLLQPLHTSHEPKQRPSEIPNRAVEESGPQLYLLASPPGGRGSAENEDPGGG